MKNQTNKVVVASFFHNRETKISIKKSYFLDTTDGNSALNMLSYEIYDNGRDKIYAQKKLNEIKNKLCGQSDCRCGFNVIKII